MSELESWQKVPAKIISEAIKHGRKQTDEDNFLSFLLLDVGMEMVFKTYLALPKYITGAITSDDERNLASRKGFHDVVEAVKNSRHGINVHDLGRVSFFHGIRNKLYHQGNGLTVRKESVDEYINVAIRLIKNLLKFDILPLVSVSGLSTEEQKIVLQHKQAIHENIEKAKMLRVELYEVYELAVEKIEQDLVVPSFKRKFESIRHAAFSEDGYSYDGNDVVFFKKLPNDNKQRLGIVSALRDLCDDIFKRSKFSELILADYEIKNAVAEEDIKNQLGVKNVKIEHEIIPVAYSVVFEQYFDLNRFYMNIVNRIVYGDNSQSFFLDYVVYSVEGFRPALHDENEIEYWESLVVTSKGQVSDLEMYIEHINAWISSEIEI